jgi:hypothetical protein
VKLIPSRVHEVVSRVLTIRHVPDVALHRLADLFEVVPFVPWRWKLAVYVEGTRRFQEDLDRGAAR